jgi:hypothetical protein
MQPDFDDALDNQLSARQRMKTVNPNVEKVFTRKQIEQAFIETFDLVGGIPRLALWANQEENYGKFLELLMKLAPKDTGAKVHAAVLEYRTNIPSSPLNRKVEKEEVAEGEFRDDV